MVDDDSDLRSTITEVFEDLDIGVKTAGDGETGLQMLRGAPFDAVLLDLGLPKLDGWEFRVRQKHEPAIADVPVVVLTGDPTAKAQAIDAAVVLTKPIDAETLVREVKRVVDVGRRNTEGIVTRAHTDRLISLGTMAASMAHEVNNPLTYVTTNLAFAHERLSHAGFEEDVLASIEDAQEGAARIRTIAADFTRFARADYQPARVVDIVPAIDAALRMAHVAHLTLEVDRAIEPLPAVMAIPERLTQVLLNLLANAAQAFVPSIEMRRPRVQVTAKPEVGSVVIDVEDNGPGISPEIVDHIFDPFFSTKNDKGAGLGLTLSRELLRAMGGDLQLRPVRGRGAAFRITLPVAPS